MTNQTTPEQRAREAFIKIADDHAMRETPEYGRAAAVVTLAEESGFEADGTDFSVRCEQCKELIGRVIPVLQAERRAGMEEAAKIAEDKGGEYEKLGDYGINQRYVSKVGAANDIAAAIRAKMEGGE